MKGKSLTKRALSLVLCAVMLVSCWVFTAPTADAANVPMVANTSYSAGTSDSYCYGEGGQAVKTGTASITSGINTSSQVQSNLTDNQDGKYRVRILIVEDRTSSTSLNGFDKSVHDNVDYVAGIEYGSTVRNLTGTTLKNDRNASGTNNPNNSASTSYPYWCEYARIDYKNMNGTGDVGHVWFNIGDRDSKGREQIISTWGTDYGYFPSDEGILIDGFPTEFLTHYYKGDTSNTDGYYAFLQIATYNGSTWSWPQGTQSKGTDMEIWKNPSYAAGLASGHIRENKKAAKHFYIGSAMTTYNSTYTYNLAADYSGVAVASYPYACSTGTTAYTSNTYASGQTNAPAFSMSTINAPDYSGNSVSTYFKFKSPKDQYGTIMSGKISTAYVDPISGVSYTGTTFKQNLANSNSVTNKITFTSDYTANLAGTNNQQKIKASIVWPQYYNNTSKKRQEGDATLTINDAEYNVNFKDSTGAVISQTGFTNPQTVSFGCDATAPTVTQTKASTATYHYTWNNGWNRTYTNITGETTGLSVISGNPGEYELNVSPTFNSTAHNNSTYWTYVDNNDSSTHTRKCKTCNYVFNSSLTHSAASAVEENVNPATCMTAGSYDNVVYCQYCTYEFSRVNVPISKLDHVSDGVWHYDATNHWNLCSYNCGTQLNKSGHSYTESVVTPATCSAEGVMRYTCDCGYSYTGSIPKIAHTPGSAVQENVVAATCTAKGSYDSVIYCSVCSTELSRTPIETDMIAHSWNAGTVTKEATCTETGTRHFICTVCGTTKDETIAIISSNHNYPNTWTYNDSQHWKVCTYNAAHTDYYAAHSYTSSVTRAATCTQTGIMTYTCICGKTYTETIPMIAHSWNEGVITTQPTCTTQGVKTYTCSVCSTTRTEAVAIVPTNHDYSGAWQKDASQHWKVCAYNSEHIDYEADHNYSEEVITAPTCTETGEKRLTCTVCGWSYTDVIAATGHSFTSDIILENDANLKTAATCQADARYYYVCANGCGTHAGDPEGNGASFIVGDTQLSHNFVLHSENPSNSYYDPDDPAASEEDGYVSGGGYVYYECTNGCNLIYEANGISSETGTYYINTENPTVINDLQAYKDKVDTNPLYDQFKVTSPFINDYYDSGIAEEMSGLTSSAYDYSLRGASLKIDTSRDTADAKYQCIRFAEAIDIPNGVDWHVNGSETNNVVLDFGVVYTQAKYILTDGERDINKLQYTGSTTEGELGYKVYKMSVRDNNGGDSAPALTHNSSYREDATNWVGVSHHDDSYVSDEGTFTFNMLLSVKQSATVKNWDEEYCVRAYITYKLNGITYTVYDNDMGHRSVKWVAQKVVWNDNESETIRQHFIDKIFDGVKPSRPS